MIAIILHYLVDINNKSWVYSVFPANLKLHWLEFTLLKLCHIYASSVEMKGMNQFFFLMDCIYF